MANEKEHYHALTKALGEYFPKPRHALLARSDWIAQQTYLHIDTSYAGAVTFIANWSLLYVQEAYGIQCDAPAGFVLVISELSPPVFEPVIPTTGIVFLRPNEIYYTQGRRQIYATWLPPIGSELSQTIEYEPSTRYAILLNMPHTRGKVNPAILHAQGNMTVAGITLNIWPWSNLHKFNVQFPADHFSYALITSGHHAASLTASGSEHQLRTEERTFEIMPEPNERVRLTAVYSQFNNAPYGVSLFPRPVHHIA